MNIQNLELNKKYKYPTICEVLEVVEKKRGDSRNSQFKDWERYFMFAKEGHSIIATSIKETPDEKIDGRGKNEASLENLKIQHSTSEFKDIDKLILSYLSCKRTTYISISKLAKDINFINSSFSEACLAKKYYVTLLFNRGQSYLRYVHMMDVCNKVTSTIKTVINSSIKRLAEEKKVDAEYGYIIVDQDKKCNLANQDELDIIEKCEKIIMDKYNFKNKNAFINNEKHSKIFYEELNKLVLEELEYCTSLFKGYKIKSNENLFLTMDEELELCKLLNDKLITNTKKNLSTNKEKVLVNSYKLINDKVEDESKNENTFKSFNSQRLDILYIDICSGLMNAIVKI